MKDSLTVCYIARTTIIIIWYVVCSYVYVWLGVFSSSVEKQKQTYFERQKGQSAYIRMYACIRYVCVIQSALQKLQCSQRKNTSLIATVLVTRSGRYLHAAFWIPTMEVKCWWPVCPFLLLLLRIYSVQSFFSSHFCNIVHSRNMVYYRYGGISMAMPGRHARIDTFSPLLKSELQF